LTDKFDQDAYWIERHKTYRGDPRSVGNMSKSIEENLKGEYRLISAIEWIAAELKPYKSVLDVGCGYGRVASCFCDAGYEYTGIDVAPVAIEAASKREPRGHFILGSALQIKIEKKYDLISVLYVFVHMVKEDEWLALVKRLSGHIAQGGALLLADDFPEIEQRPSQHVCHRPLSRYQKVLEDCGLSRDGDFREKFSKSWKSGGSVPPFELFRKQSSAA